MPEWIPFGFPWRGLQTAVDPAQARLDEFVDGSLDMVLDNVDRKLVRRGGLSNFVSTSGIMEGGITYNAYTFRGIQLREFRCSSIGPNFDLSLMALLSHEASTTVNYAQGNFYDPVAGDFRSICETANTDFPTNCKPYPFIGGNRMKANTDRIKHAMGSRGFVDSGDAMYFPVWGTEDDGHGLGIPHRWNKKHPNSSIVAERVERLSPTGLMPPLWMPRIGFTDISASIGNNKVNWDGKDCFYISCLHVRNGAWGPYVEPRSPNDIFDAAAAGAATYDNDYSPYNVGGYGLIQLSSTATQKARAITWSGIPTAPPGYSHTVLLRSPKVDGSVAGNKPDLSDLRVVAVLPAGQTTYTDDKGNDSELAVDARVRTDPESLNKTVWPPRARYMATFDQRFLLGYLRDNPCAIVVTARGIGATGDTLNDDDESTPSVTEQCFVAIVTGDATPSHGAGNNGKLMLDLIFRDSAAGNVTNRRSYRLEDYTLETLVDRINSQGCSANDVDDATTRRWHAQLVPGANRSAPATNLMSFGRSTSVGTDFADLAATWNAALTSSPAAIVGTNFGPQRGFGPGWPCLLLFNETYMLTLPRFPDALLFSRGGPGEPAHNGDNWSFANYRRPPGNAGKFMGAGPLLDGALVAYSEKICILRNIKDGKTGADEDYRIEAVDDMRGCISPSIGVGPGFVVVLTDQGLFAYDDEKNILPIGEGLYNPATDAGELSYEIQECRKATSRDKRDLVGGGSNIVDYFSCAVGAGKIVISYRTSSSFDRPNAWLEMDFSPGIEKRGVRALIDPSTKSAWGWSARCTPKDDVDPGAGTQNNVGISAMALIRGDIAGSSSSKWFAFRDKHVSGAVEGRIDEFNTGTEDNTVNVSGVVVGKQLVAPDGRSKHLKHLVSEVVVDWNCPDAACTLEHARAGGAYGTAVSLGNSTSLRDVQKALMTRSQRTPGKVSQNRFTDPGTGSKAKLWGWSLLVETIDLGEV